MFDILIKNSPPTLVAIIPAVFSPILMWLTLPAVVV